MKNLFLFFNKIRFFLFFILLQLIVFTIIGSNSDYQQSRYLNSSNFLSGWIYFKKKQVKDYFNLKSENNILESQNASLKEASFNNYLILSSNEIKIDDSRYLKQYLFQPAEVIQFTTSTRSNILTLNVGSNKGVSNQMGVVSSKGVVGFVTVVSPHFSTALSMMNRNFKIPVKPKGDSCTGILTWEEQNGINTVSVKSIPTYFTINTGDTIVTQGGSGIFPPNVQVGVVEAVKKDQGTNNHLLLLKTSVDFHSNNHVFVVKNELKPELDSIQNIDLP